MKKALLFLLVLGLFSACGSDDNSGGTPEPSDNFSRKDLLSSIANNYIVPSVSTYSTDASNLKTAWETFIATPNATNGNAVKVAFNKARTAFQAVELLEIGQAESNKFVYFSNTYPANTADIDANISSGNTTLNLPSTYDEQGFPALDYLLFGKGDLTTLVADSNYKSYTSTLINKLTTLAEEVKDDWQGTYKTTFINNDGTGATASVDLFANDFVFYYEKRLRAGKVGIPAGVFGDAGPNATKTEARFEINTSRAYLVKALDNFKTFLNVQDGYLAYLDAVNAKKDGELLSKKINDQIGTARAKINTLNTDLGNQVTSDNSKMLEAYDELQKLVVLLKVDMTQALNIQITYLDADGD